MQCASSISSTLSVMPGLTRASMRVQPRRKIPFSTSMDRVKPRHDKG